MALDEAAEKTEDILPPSTQRSFGRDKTHAANHIENKTYYCQLCKVPLAETHALKRHNQSKGHLRKAKDLATKKHKCTLCSWASNSVGHYNQNIKSKSHMKMAAAAKAALSSSQLD
jgi:hypothetical protein